MLVLDANILIRAVLGSSVLALLRDYEDRVEFLAPVERCRINRQLASALTEENLNMLGFGLLGANKLPQSITVGAQPTTSISRNGPDRMP